MSMRLIFSVLYKSVLLCPYIHPYSFILDGSAPIHSATPVTVTKTKYLSIKINLIDLDMLKQYARVPK